MPFSIRKADPLRVRSKSISKAIISGIVITVKLIIHSTINKLRNEMSHNQKMCYYKHKFSREIITNKNFKYEMRLI